MPARCVSHTLNEYVGYHITKKIFVCGRINIGEQPRSEEVGAKGKQTHRRTNANMKRAGGGNKCFIAGQPPREEERDYDWTHSRISGAAAEERKRKREEEEKQNLQGL